MADAIDVGDSPDFIDQRRGVDVLDVTDHEQLAQCVGPAGQVSQGLQHQRPAVLVERTEHLIEHDEAGRIGRLRADDGRKGKARAERDCIPLAARKLGQRERAIVVVDPQTIVVVELDPIVPAVGDGRENLGSPIGQHRGDSRGHVLVELRELLAHPVEVVGFTLHQVRLFEQLGKRCCLGDKLVASMPKPVGRGAGLHESVERGPLGLATLPLLLLCLGERERIEPERQPGRGKGVPLPRERSDPVTDTRQRGDPLGTTGEPLVDGLDLTARIARFLDGGLGGAMGVRVVPGRPESVDFRGHARAIGSESLAIPMDTVEFASGGCHGLQRGCL
jgi:hypothetical protein